MFSIATGVGGSESGGLWCGWLGLEETVVSQHGPQHVDAAAGQCADLNQQPRRPGQTGQVLVQGRKT
jgi:hypothetical protein